MPAPRWVARPLGAGVGERRTPWTQVWPDLPDTRVGLPAPEQVRDRADVRFAFRLGAKRRRGRRRRYQVDNPRIYRDEDATEMPAFIRFMLRKVIRAPEFLSLDVVSA